MREPDDSALGPRPRPQVAPASVPEGQAGQQRTIRDNADVASQYTWLSALDERTCEVCAHLDGAKFDVASPDARWPPAHVGCRCGAVPVVDWSALGFTPLPPGTRAAKFGPVSDDTTYVKWLAQQSAAFQEEVHRRWSEQH